MIIWSILKVPSFTYKNFTAAENSYHVFKYQVFKEMEYVFIF